MTMRRGWSWALVVVVQWGLIAGVRADFFVQTNLVSNVAGQAANVDPNLRNPWGISSSPTSPFWVSDQATGKSTLYNSIGTPQSLVVSVPPGPGSPLAGPTGQVFNPTSSFLMSNGAKAQFLFADLSGVITAWNPAAGTAAERVVLNAGSVYTGLALASRGAAGDFLYAADRANGRIEVFDTAFRPPTDLPGTFNDPALPAGFTPYNIQNLGSLLYVTYINPLTGGGIVNAFDANGIFLRRIAANGPGGPLQNPWGLALAPASFGDIALKLLVGNETDGRISVFDPNTGAFGGQLLDGQGNPISNPGLHGLIFGNGGNGGDPRSLYFTAGGPNGTGGLFGRLTLVPEPSAFLLLALGGFGAALTRRRRP